MQHPNTILARLGALLLALMAAPAWAAPLNGQCGTANGSLASVLPSANLCSAGTASSVTSTNASGGPWTWQCTGIGTGATSASCATDNFYDNGDGSVTDWRTNLVWDRCSVGQTWDSTNQTCTNPADPKNPAGAIGQFTWDASFPQPVNKNTQSGGYKGHSDWRLPTVQELATLIQGTNCPSIDTTAFPAVSVDCVGNQGVNSDYWTSTNDSAVAGAAWFVAFSGGHSYDWFWSSSYSVRLVRSGQYLDPFGVGTNAPAMGAIATTSATVNIPAAMQSPAAGYTIAAADTVYYVLVAGGSGTPNPEQVWKGVSNGANPPIASNNQKLSASATTSIALSKLTPGTAYDLYLIGTNCYTRSPYAACSSSNSGDSNDISQVSGANASGLNVIKLSFTTQTVTTTTITNTAPLQSTYGQAFSINVAVAPVTGTTQPTSGSVTCTLTPTDGIHAPTSLQTVINSGSNASKVICAVSATQLAGSYMLTASYAPDPTDPMPAFAASTSAQTTLTINPAPLTITANPRGKTYGTVDPTLTYAIGTLGLVNNDPASTVGGSLARAAGENVGTYAINQGTLSAGSNYTIAFTGANFTISAASTATALSNSPASSVFGQAVTLTAMVSDTATGSTGMPNGSVAFSEGGNALPGCSAVPVSGMGTAQCQSSSLGVASHSITATYSPGSSNFTGSASAATTQTVTKAATTTTITPPGAITLGNPVTVSASVAVTSPGGGTPSGTIAISDGGTGTGDTCTITLPSTSCMLTPSSGGTKALTASYSGDGSFATSGAPSASLTVNPSQPGTVLISSAATSVFGQSVTLTATITPATGGAIPKGLVTFCDGATTASDAACVGGTTLCPATTVVAGTGNASATCVAPSLSVATHALSAVYSGDGSNNKPSNAILSQIVNAANTTTTIGSLSAITLGNSVTVNVSVAAKAPGQGTPGGSVTVTDGSANCTATLNASSAGSCSLTPPAPAGNHSISAVYTATTNFATSTGTTTLTVNAAASGTRLASSASTSVFGQGVTFTAIVTPQAGNPSPTGTVAFTDGTTTLCASVNLDITGTATCAASNLAVGSHTIQASYGGDNNTAKSSATLSQTVNAANTTTTIAALSAITLGSNVTVNVSVAATAPGQGTPTGSVTVTDGSANCMATLNASGAGSCSLTPPAPAGNHSISAVYTATKNFATSTGSATLTVNSATAGTTLTSSANPSMLGQSVTLTATVTPTSGNPTPTGVINFTDGSSAIAGCTSITLSGGSAACTTSALAVGSHTIQASYGGDTNTAKSSATLSQTVNKDTTTMTLTASPNPAGSGQTVTLTATVYGDPPGGVVTFYDGTAILGAGTLAATSTTSSVATFSISALASGTHALTATFAGDGNNQASASAVITIAVNTPPVPAPALDRWALLLLCGLMGAVAVFARCSRAM